MNDFQFKPFQEMTDSDYAEIGFRSGLEIHQQLLTTKKLFCRCPAGRYSPEYNAEILRHMRPTLSELGEYDGTALMEFKTRKEIIYRINRETVCTYEMDDTPPFMPNDEALDRALGIAMLYGLALVDEIHIARKQYLDGSIPTGFQRTTILGIDGSIPYKGRSIKIIQLGMEEDACREVSDQGHVRIYATDRLGMPLIETVTGPDMRTPGEVAEVAQICRRLVRSTGWVRTGIGAAREDVNVSVTGGTRIEIKGVPRIPRIPLLTYNEAMRQWNLLRLREELHRRGIKPETFAAETIEATRILAKTSYMPIRESLNAGLTARCVVLRGFGGLLNWQTQTGTHFSREISDRVRVIACLTKLPNIIHSDSPSDNISSSEWEALRKAGKAGRNDALVVVWGDDRDTVSGANEITIRAREATVGIPSETRQALIDGTNGFERILPGPERMYPDTDLPPVKITAERLAGIKNALPGHIWDREAAYRRAGLSGELAVLMSYSAYATAFEKVIADGRTAPGPVASILVRLPKLLRARRIDPAALSCGLVEAAFALLKEGALSREGVVDVLLKAAGTGRLPEVDRKPAPTADEIDKAINESEAAVSALGISDVRKKEQLLTGAAMDKLERRTDGAGVADKVRTMLHGGK